MKVSLMKLIGSLSCAAFLMTSCLGDGDSSFQSDRSFAYITSESGVKVAATNVGFIRTDKGAGMENLIPEECYFVSFKITSTQPSSGIYPAEYINALDNGYPISQNGLYPGEPYSDISLENQNDSTQVNSLELLEYYPAAEVFGDRWLFKYTAPNVREDDNVRAYFYYDSNNQKNEKGETIGLSQNKIVIDVRFIKVEGSGSGTTKSKDYVYVGNFELLRGYTPNYNKDGYARVAVKFRYVTPASGTVIVPTAKFYPTGDAAWDGDGNSSLFLYYTQN